MTAAALRETDEAARPVRAEPLPIRGVADAVRLPRVLSGWVDAGALPPASRPVMVEVLADGAVIGAGLVDRERPDISQDPAVPAGFQVTCRQDLKDWDLATAAITVRARTADGAEDTLPLYGPIRAEALDRLLEGLGMPAEAALRAALADGAALDEAMQARLASLANTAAGTPTPTPMREVMMGFESLGADCGLGSAQRHFGAEPLGLLRFSSIGLAALRAALADEFHGVGSPRFTRMEPDERGEFFTSDTRYQMQAHTFLFAGEHDRERLFARQCRKIQYLARNLLEVLREGSKILVIHDLPRDLPVEGLAELLGQVRRYGRCPVLYVRAARPGAPAGEARHLGGLLYEGRVLVEDDEAQHSPVEIFASWGSMCAYVHAMVHAQAEGTPR